jgi:hypothetical protein
VLGSELTGSWVKQFLREYFIICSTFGRIGQTVARLGDSTRALEGPVPKTARAAYLRERAATFRRLAKEHSAAGSLQISAKMTEVAADFEAQAAALDRGEQAA